MLFPLQKFPYILIFSMVTVQLSLSVNLVIFEVPLIGEVLVGEGEFSHSLFNSFIEGAFELSLGGFLFSGSMRLIITPLPFVFVVGAFVDEESIIVFDGIADEIASIWKDIDGFESLPVA